MSRYYVVTNKSIRDEVLKLSKQHAKDVRSLNRELRKLGFKVTNFSMESRSKEVVGFYVKSLDGIDTSKFIKRELPVLVPKSGTSLKKLLSQCKSSVRECLENALGTNKQLCVSVGKLGLCVKHMAYGIYGDTVVVCMPEEMEFKKGIVKRITDVEFEKIENSK